MSIQTFCPNCGSPRLPGARFCGSCGQAFDAAAVSPATTTGSPQRAPAPNPEPASASGPPAVLAGVAWLITAALSGYLAYQQWTLSQQLASLGIGDEGLGAYAAWNAVAGAITLFFGARLLTSPSRRLLDASAAWAVLSVLGGLAQMASGTGNDVFAWGTIAAAAAGVLSFVARQAIPRAPTQAMTAAAPGWLAGPGPNASSVSASVTTADRPPSSSGTAEKVVIGLIIMAVLGGGTLLLLNAQAQRSNEIASAVPTAPPRATAFSRTSAPIDEYVAQMGEAVDLVDLSDNSPLGSVTVIKNGKPSELLGSGPTPGYRYIAALVRYAAEATWSYNLYDWAVHDSSGIQYDPLFYAPNPSLSYGDLPAGRKVEAWVAFEVPEGVRDVWLDYGGAPVVFTVKID